MVAGKVRLSNLYSVLEDKKLAGLITIGAPEGLCNAIARLEDKEEANDETGNKRKCNLERLVFRIPVCALLQYNLWSHDMPDVIGMKK